VASSSLTQGIHRQVMTSTLATLAAQLDGAVSEKAAWCGGRCVLFGGRFD
jgi:hypothetical protein